MLTSDLSYKKDGVVVVHSVEEALEKVASYKSEDIYVIGGESVFEQFLPYCDVAHITSVDDRIDGDGGFSGLAVSDDQFALSLSMVRFIWMKRDAFQILLQKLRDA